MDLETYLKDREAIDTVFAEQGSVSILCRIILDDGNELQFSIVGDSMTNPVLRGEIPE